VVLGAGDVEVEGAGVVGRAAARARSTSSGERTPGRAGPVSSTATARLAITPVTTTASSQASEATTPIRRARDRARELGRDRSRCTVPSSPLRAQRRR
jgi:hypothetical protein